MQDSGNFTKIEEVREIVTRIGLEENPCSIHAGCGNRAFNSEKYQIGERVPKETVNFFG